MLRSYKRRGPDCSRKLGASKYPAILTACSSGGSFCWGLLHGEGRLSCRSRSQLQYRALPGLLCHPKTVNGSRLRELRQGLHLLHGGGRLRCRRSHPPRCGVWHCGPARGRRRWAGSSECIMNTTSSAPTCMYLTAMASVLWPVRALTRNTFPVFSARRVAAVRRRSCRCRSFIPARSQARSMPFLRAS